MPDTTKSYRRNGLSRGKAGGHNGRRHRCPLLALAETHPDATDLFADGEDQAGLRRHAAGYALADPPGLTLRAVEAACTAAAVFASVEFSPRSPALPRFSVKNPPDLRVSYTRPLAVAA
jgi:hypothetical protein